MAIGMTYEQYWYGDPLMVRAFYKAEQLRQQRIDEEAWLNGVYVRHALQSALSVSELFRPKGRKPYEYPEQPLMLEKTEKIKTETSKQEEQEKERLRLVAYLNMVAQSQRNKN